MVLSFQDNARVKEREKKKGFHVKVGSRPEVEAVYIDVSYFSSLSI